MLDAEGYPTEADLEKIRTWPANDFRGLMDFIKERWEYECFNEEDRNYSLSTFGWSGNEEIIAAMQMNRIFWSMCWECSRRGGYYEFRVK